jgi:hypothetical protein
VEESDNVEGLVLRSYQPLDSWRVLDFDTYKPGHRGLTGVVCDGLNGLEVMVAVDLESRQKT